jgi:chitinase
MLRFSPRSAKFLSLLCVALFSAVALPLAQAQTSSAKPRLPKRLVADYDYGSKALTPPYGAAQIPYHKLTHINHAGVPWDSTGTLSVPDGFLEPELIAKAHAAGVKVLLLTGGDFAAAENDPTVLNAVIANLQAFVSANGYDGLDIDWEFPSTDADCAFFVELMSRLRAAFPSPRYTLSIDVAPWNRAYYNLRQLKKSLDYFNLMVYDCAGPWTSLGHLNSAIFWDQRDPNPSECEPAASDQQAIDMYSKDVPLVQLNLGTPFYGYYYTNIDHEFQTCPNAIYTSDGYCDNTVLTENYGPFIKALVGQPEWQRRYDPIALVPYLVRTDGTPGYITYDDDFSTFTRVRYADWTRGIGGTFMWSLDADYDGHSQDLLDAMYLGTLVGH